MSETTSARARAQPFYKRPLAMLLVATAAWIAIVATILVRREQCGTATVPVFPDGLLGLHEHYLACRSLNEFGDFLAGVFAPVALIWVAGAVYIQSQELKAQRKELALARHEARQTRAVLVQQAAESRAATEVSRATQEYIARQTMVMEQEQSDRNQQRANRQFDQIIETMMSSHRYLAVLPVEATFIEHRLDARHAFTAGWGKSNTVKADNKPRDFMAEFRSNARRAIRDFDSSEREVTVIDWSAAVLDMDIATMEVLIDLQSQLTVDHRVYAMSLGLGGLLRDLREVRPLLDAAKPLTPL